VPEQNTAAMGRGGWATAGVPTVEHYAEDYLKSLEQLA